MGGSIRRNSPKDANKLRHIINTVSQFFPGLPERMHAGPALIEERGIIRRTGAFDLNQPEIRDALCTIAAKLTLAVYYERSRMVAEESVKVSALWTHAQNPDTRQSVQNILSLVGSGVSLKQGKWDTKETFFIKQHEEDGQFFVIAIFHETVALIGRLFAGGDPRLHHAAGQLVLRPARGQGIIPA